MIHSLFAHTRVHPLRTERERAEILEVAISLVPGQKEIHFTTVYGFIMSSSVLAARCLFHTAPEATEDVSGPRLVDATSTNPPGTGLPKTCAVLRSLCLEPIARLSGALTRMTEFHFLFDEAP